jgi:hypothetical protein
MDPHPEDDGHKALYRLCSDVLRNTFDKLEPLTYKTLTYHAGVEGAGSMDAYAQSFVAFDGVTTYTTIANNAFTPAIEGYRYIDWRDSNNVAYSGGQVIGLNDSLTLTAQWNNEYTVAYCKVYGITDTATQVIFPPESNGGPIYKDGVDGPYYLKFKIGDNNGELSGNFSEKSNGVNHAKIQTTTVSYDTKLWMNLINVGDVTDCEVYLNGNRVAVGNNCSYELKVKGNVAITFTWKAHNEVVDSILGVPIYKQQSYWIANITMQGV